MHARVQVAVLTCTYRFLVFQGGLVAFEITTAASQRLQTRGDCIAVTHPIRVPAHPFGNARLLPPSLTLLFSLCFFPSPPQQPHFLGSHRRRHIAVCPYRWTSCRCRIAPPITVNTFLLSHNVRRQEERRLQSRHALGQGVPRALPAASRVQFTSGRAHVHNGEPSRCHLGLLWFLHSDDRYEQIRPLWRRLQPPFLPSLRTGMSAS